MIRRGAQEKGQSRVTGVRKGFRHSWDLRTEERRTKVLRAKKLRSRDEKGTRQWGGEGSEWKSNEVRNCFSSLFSALSRERAMAGCRGIAPNENSCAWAERADDECGAKGKRIGGRWRGLSALKSFQPRGDADFPALEYLAMRSDGVRLG